MKADELLTAKNAVGAIRVSSTRQGTEGDSPEAQKEQIERFAASKGFMIKKFFVFMESASKEQQPMQEAIDYCKDPENRISHFIIKSIDRFTRGGSLPYDLLKSQLEDSQVKLIDIYGIIGSSQVNTLEHLGVEYKWSVYSPSKKSEILEAERSKDELRDIMTRMVGAEIRYTRLGYWMRRPPYGYLSQKAETPHGRRTVLAPHPTESKYILEVFRLRAEGQHTDEEITRIINDMGYEGRKQLKGSKGGRRPIRLNSKHLWRLVRNPIYAGVNMEKWTGGQPIRCAFEGLVSVETFNRANKGKRVIVEQPDGRITAQDTKQLRYSTEKGTRSADFPFKKFVMCPKCDKPLLGSSSRGGNGKLYPAYHCNKRGHNFRVSKKELEDRVDQFLASLELSSESVEPFLEVTDKAWQRIQSRHDGRVNSLDKQLSGLREEVQATVQKLKYLNNESAVKYMEEDLTRLEAEISKIEAEKEAAESQKPKNINRFKACLIHLVEHYDQILKNQMDPVKKAKFFSLLFSKMPTFEDLEGRTDKKRISQVLNPIFALNFNKQYPMVTPRGIEPLFPE